jgi:hypothetical protein
MKLVKVIIASLLLYGSMQAQTFIQDTTLKQSGRTTGVVSGKIRAQNVFSVNNVYVYVDSLKYGDTIKVFYAGRQWKYLFMAIVDTSLGTSGHLTDTLIYSAYDTVSNTWSSSYAGLRDMQTNIVNNSTYLIGGDGGSHTGMVHLYQLNAPYPQTVRVRRTNVSNIVGRTTWIKWILCN